MLPIVEHVAQLVERVIVAPKVAVVVLVVPLSERSPAVLAAPSNAPIVVARVARIIAPSTSIGREEELVVDANRVTTIIRLLFPDGRSTEYRRVSNRWGAIYFFKDGLNVPEELYAAGVAL